MKIGFLLGNAQGNGGIARVVSIIANELCKDNDIYIISFCPTEEYASYKYDSKVSFENLYDNKLTMTKAILQKNAIYKLRTYIKKNNLDIMVACGDLYFPLCIASVVALKTRCFCWEHTNPVEVNDHKFQMFSRKVAIRFANKIIVLTKETKKYYINDLKCSDCKIVQIYNPVGKNVAQSEKYDVNSKKIISVGRLSYPKNFQLLVKIAAEVLSRYSEWTWDICGEGEDRKELEKLIKDYKLENKLILRGQVNNLYSQYSQYSFQVMTSRYEGFPMSLIEGAANRLPLIAFDIQTGPSEIIDDTENGYLIKNNNFEIMVNDIRNLIENPILRKRMSIKAYEKSKEFNLNQIVNQWRKLCQ